MRKLILTLAFLTLTANAWAFPQNGILDSFTGCTDTTTPPNSNWTNAVLRGATSSTVDCEDQAATSTSTGTGGDAYYDITTFNSNQEAFVTAATGFGSSDLIGVCARLINIGANTTDGYCAYTDNTADLIVLERLDDGVSTNLHSSALVPAVGDSIGIATIGSQICVWYKTAAGSWTQTACATDTTYSTAGHIGILVRGPTATGVADDFGGGNVSVARGGPIFLQ